MDEQNPSMFHLMKMHNAEIKSVAYETDRARFIGRGNTIHHPEKMFTTDTLSNSQGPVLDPVIAIQYRIVIEPQQTVIADMVIGIADTRDVCNSLVEKYQDKYLSDRAFELSWTHGQVVLRQINATEHDAQLYSRLAASVIYANASLRTDPNVIVKNYRGQSGLWSYSISGDLPIVLLQIEDSDNIELVKQLIQAHAYWRLKGLIVDLVIWNEDHGGYRQTLQNQILGLVMPSAGAEMKEQPGGIFIRSADQISNEDRILFQTVARIIISDKYGTLEEQIGRREKAKLPVAYFSPSKFHPSLPAVDIPTGDLQFFNGLGGFSADGKEYVITTAPNKNTPAPWINVLANDTFGTIISESGQSYTWIENAHEFRLTPWSNDAVSDRSGEAFFIRDEESGRFWSPTPLQSRGKSSYVTRHGFGYSKFEHIEDGIHTAMTVFVDLHAPVKFMVLKFHNRSGRPRRLSATGYMEWVMGDLRPKSQMQVITEMNTEDSAIFARNAYNTALQNKVAFFEVDNAVSSFTADRTEFIGRNGILSNPEAMNKARLSGKLGAALDPCAALQVVFDLDEGDTQEVIFKLGAGNDYAHAVEVIRQFKNTDVVYAALESVQEYWKKTLGVIRFETPDAALNILANGWLNYQALACRIWARSGFYQSGGAFGFRDQLQDVLSLLYNKPNIVRKQILLNASRQFKEGDVQHWWHPPAGRGVRTTCSDDYLWLPYVTTKYVQHTGDNEILDETVNFLEGRLLNSGEESYYDLPIQSDLSADLYTHCVKAIEHGLQFGEHGLPLMGSGDWNDGMDKVGMHGKGESVWLAFFLYDVLANFENIAQLRNDIAFKNKCAEQAEKLQRNIEKHAWDGNWYRRAYFDDGAVLGSADNDECKIDSIAQSWSVLSKAGDAGKAQTAMQSAGKYLVKQEAGIIQLFDPPFDKSALNPGYIKGYVPGVRENGGQYTHAAIWLVMAYAALKDKNTTWQLLQMINPINRGKDEAAIKVYKVEPYVMAADVYAVKTHLGAGGWTWYTGSAGWMYQLITTSFIGMKQHAEVLSFDPCIPQEWNECKVNYIFCDTTYQITLIQNSGANEMKVWVDDTEQFNRTVALKDDKLSHIVKVVLS
jgi:cellobiose phosphorylase